MKQETEIVVAGGGITGTATAYYLAKAGKDVVLVERGDLTRGSSAANAGFVWITYRAPGPALRLGLATLDSYDEMSKNHDMEYEKCGGLTLFETENLFKDMAPFVDVRKNAGLSGLKFLDRNGLLQLEPHLAPFVLGALLNPLDGHINPMRAVYAYAAEARKHGAQLHTGVEITGINIEKGHVKSVITNKGEIKTKYIVNACGAHAPVLGKMVGLKVPIGFQREQILVSEEVPGIVGRPMFTASYKKTVQQGGVGGFTTAFFANQTKKGNLILGGVNDFPGEVTSTTFEAFEAISREAIRYLPILKTLSVRAIRSFAKFYIHTPDALPVLGKVKGIEGFIMASGLNDFGMGVGPGAGKVISELICLGEPSIPLDGFSLSRFEN
ncbi:MAG: FAD-binding oxidoreductase [Chloroflexi bacterium]|nr:FAD-binding oxidoreductase [Chloroflexota bacterium]